MILVIIINGLKLNTSQLSSAILEAVNLFPLAKKNKFQIKQQFEDLPEHNVSPQMMIFNYKLIL